MASGNHTFTYVGAQADVVVQGQKFLRYDPAHVTDNGIAAELDSRGDFVRGEASPPVLMPPPPPPKRRMGFFGKRK